MKKRHFNYVNSTFQKQTSHIRNANSAICTKQIETINHRKSASFVTPEHTNINKTHQRTFRLDKYGQRHRESGKKLYRMPTFESRPSHQITIRKHRFTIDAIRAHQCRFDRTTSTFRRQILLCHNYRLFYTVGGSHPNENNFIVDFSIWRPNPAIQTVADNSSRICSNN